MDNLKVLGNMIGSVVVMHGNDACLEYCNVVYSSLYRTDAVFTFADMITEDEHHSESLLRELTTTAALYLAIRDGVVLETSDTHPDHHEVNRELSEPYTADAKQSVLNGLQFVEMVNYKGEGEGYEVKELAKLSRKYNGKYDYS